GVASGLDDLRLVPFFLAALCGRPVLGVAVAKLLAGKRGPRPVGGLLIGVTGGRGRFFIGFLRFGVLRERRPGHDERGHEPRQDHSRDPHREFSLERQADFRGAIWRFWDWASASCRPARTLPTRTLCLSRWPV